VPFLFNVLNLLQYRKNTVPQENKAAKSSSIFLKSLTLYCIEGKKKSLYLIFFLLPNLMCFSDVLFLDGITVRTLFSEAECNLCNKVFAEH